MKNKKIITIFLSLLALSACLLIFSHCRMEPAKTAGSAVFGFADRQARSGTAPSPADISAVILTVTDAGTGDVILDNHKMTLSRFNSTYISGSIDLMQGNYKLTQFLVVDDLNSTVYAAPLEGSPKAGMVGDPLPMNFSVTPDTTTNVQTEVTVILSTDTPQDYGYSEFSFNIVLDPKSWSSINQIDSITGVASKPETALDDYGRSITAWKEQNGSIINLWASRYTPQAGWGTPVLLDALNTADAGIHKITMDGDGNAIVVWSQHNGTAYHLWAKRYVQGSGWQAIEDIAITEVAPPDLVFSTDGTGNTFVAWICSGKIFARRYAKTGGWDADVATIYNNSSYTAYQFSLDSNDNGNAAVVCTTNATVFYIAYDPVSGWKPYTSLFSHSPYYGYNSISVSLDNPGNMTLAYAMCPTSSSCYVYGRRYTQQAGISSAYSLDLESYDYGIKASVGSDNLGNAIVAWIDGSDNIVAAYYDLEFGWQTAVNLFNGTSYTSQPRVTLDEYGNGVVMWTGVPETVAPKGMYYCCYDSTGGWKTTTLLEETTLDSSAFSMDMNFSGAVSAAWEKKGTGTNLHIQAAFYK